MFKFLTKVGMTGGAVSGVVFADVASIDQMPKLDKKIPKDLDQITSIDDIYLFESMHGCFFGFVKAWRTKTVYGAREFVEKVVAERNSESRKTWTDKVIAGANNEEAKNWCKKNGGIITLDNKLNKGFKLGVPGKGW